MSYVVTWKMARIEGFRYYLAVVQDRATGRILEEGPHRERKSDAFNDMVALFRNLPR